MLKLIAGLVVFLGIHSTAIVASGWRERTIARIGVGPWKVLYAIVALIGFVLIVHGYAEARLEPVLLYHPPFWLRHLAALLMLPVFPLLLATYLPGRIKAAVKHPMLTATKAWALAHLLVNGMLADVLLFGGFLVWAVVDRISAGKRPQAAVRSAPATGSIRNDVIAVVGGLLLYAFFFMWAHVRLFGVAPMG
jgi:uncharacterized membrane protein